MASDDFHWPFFCSIRTNIAVLNMIVTLNLFQGLNSMIDAENKFSMTTCYKKPIRFLNVLLLLQLRDPCWGICSVYNGNCALSDGFDGGKDIFYV